MPMLQYGCQHHIIYTVLGSTVNVTLYHYSYTFMLAFTCRLCRAGAAWQSCRVFCHARWKEGIGVPAPAISCPRQKDKMQSPSYVRVVYLYRCTVLLHAYNNSVRHARNCGLCVEPIVWCWYPLANKLVRRWQPQHWMTSSWQFINQVKTNHNTNSWDWP